MSDAPETPASRGMDPTVKGILAATIGLSALGGLLIAAVDQLDVPPPEVSTGDGGDRPEDSLEAERAREVASRLERARVLLGEGRFAAGSAALEQVLALEPGQPEALRMRGAAAVEQVLLQDDATLLEEALTDLERAVEAAPKDAEAWAYLGLARGLVERPTAATAIEACDQAVELDPASRGGLHRGLLRALAARAGDDADLARQALRDLDPAVKRAPSARALGLRAVMHALAAKPYAAWFDAAAALEAVDGLEAQLAPGLAPGDLRELLLEVDSIPAEARGEAARKLALLLASPEPETRAAAGFALSRLGPDAAAALPALIEAVDDQEEGVRLAVSESLTQLGSAGAAAEPALLAQLEARREDHVVHALAAVSASENALAALVKLLGDDDEFLRAAAVQALGSLGQAARGAGPALHKALGRDLKRDEPRIAYPAMQALARIMRPDQALPAFEYALRHADPTVRLGAVDALGLIAPTEPEARALIEGAMTDEHELVRERVKETLAALGKR